MREQYDIAQNVNQTLVLRYQTMKDEALAVKEINKTLELANAALAQ